MIGHNGDAYWFHPIDDRWATPSVAPVAGRHA